MLYIKRSMVSGILVFGMLSGGLPAVEARTNRKGTISVTPAPGETITNGGLFVQTTARALTDNRTIVCTSGTTKVGSFKIDNLVTGGYTYVPGIGTTGAISITGTDMNEALVTRSGTGLSVAAAASQWVPDPATDSGTVNWAAGVLTSVSVPTEFAGPTLPDGKSAEQLFDMAMGPFARRNNTFAPKTNRTSTSPTSYYVKATVPLSIEGATASTGAAVMGIKLIGGNWVAIISAGAASYGSYVGGSAYPAQ